MKNNTLLSFIALFVFFGIGHAQVEVDSELYKTLKANDSLLFDEGFNKCNLKAFENLIADDLEFYHDVSGITNSKAEFIETFKNNICGNLDNKSKRALVPGTLQVFPLYNSGQLYGAIQKGEHRFFVPVKGGSETPGSIAKFTHLWLKEESGWKIKRVLSYDHKSERKSVTNKIISLPESELAIIAGTYKAQQAGTVVISLIEGVLQVKTGEMQANIYPKSSLVFFHKEAPLTFEFIKNKNGGISKMVVSENGKVVEEAIRE